MKLTSWCALACAALLLAGCEGSKDEELRSWAAEQRAQTRPRVTPLTEPKQFVPEDYTGQNGTDPFALEKLTRAMRSDSTRASANAGLIAPELARRKEPLESFPLDSMAMVGSLTRANQPVALLRQGSMLYQVRVGEHLGQNYGRVMGITENELKLREIVQDATGDWTERDVSLQLQEKSK